MVKPEQEEPSCSIVQVALDEPTVALLNRLARQTSLPWESLIPIALAILEREGVERFLQERMPDHPLP